MGFIFKLNLPTKVKPLQMHTFVKECCQKLNALQTSEQLVSSKNAKFIFRLYQIKSLCIYKIGLVQCSMLLGDVVILFY